MKVVGLGLGVCDEDSRRVCTDIGRAEMELVSVLVRLLMRAASSEPTSLPYVKVVLRVEWLLTSSCSALILCHVFRRLPTEPRSNALMKRELWSIPRSTSPEIS